MINSTCTKISDLSYACKPKFKYLDHFSKIVKFSKYIGSILDPCVDNKCTQNKLWKKIFSFQIKSLKKIYFLGQTMSTNLKETTGLLLLFFALKIHKTYSLM